MGKLTIEGRASGEYAYDLMDVSVEFLGKAETPSKALNNLLEQCEKFLSVVTKNGIPMESIRMDSDRVSEGRSYRDEKEYYKAIRKIIVRIPFNMDLLNSFLKVIEEENLMAELTQEYILSKEEEIRMELIKKAIQDANEKAEYYLDGLNQKMTGIDTIKTDNLSSNRSSSMDYEVCEQERPIACGLDNSSKIQSPTRELSEKVEIVYIIE